jgi:PAS domain S-box-containing protein
MFGYAELELQDASLAMLYPSKGEFEVQGAVGLPSLKEAGTYKDERMMKRQGGGLFWCRVTGSTLDVDEPFACTVWVFEDISYRRAVLTQLSPRERDVAQQLVHGATSKQIAKVLAISHRTVEVHRARIMKRLGAANHGQMVARLVSAG